MVDEYQIAASFKVTTTLIDLHVIAKQLTLIFPIKYTALSSLKEVHLDL